MSLVQFCVGLAIALGGLIIGIQLAVAGPAKADAGPFLAISAVAFIVVGLATMIRRNARPFNLEEPKGWLGVASMFFVMGIVIFTQFNG
jgi:hypothetical protein